MQTNSKMKSRGSRTPRIVAVTVAILLVGAAVAGGSWWYWQQEQTRQLKRAVDERIARPVGPVRLVSGMDELDEQPPTTPPAGSTDVPDAKLRVQIEMQLRQMDLPVEQIDIEVDDQRVVLAGEVDSALNRDAVEVVVRSIKGVHQVDNRIAVAE
jgi:osmotically-inducible protein OsmY